MPAEPQRNRLPFEPSKKRQKQDKNTNKSDQQQPAPKKPEIKSPNAAVVAESTPGLKTQDMAIPKVVSDRMAQRMALFCGVPTVLGIVTFIISYVVVNYGWFKLPNVAVLLVSIGFFALGVLGLSYGVLSASWDEQILGSKLGWQEFRTNWGRMTSAWRSARQKNV